MVYVRNFRDNPRNAKADDKSFECILKFGGAELVTQEFAIDK